MNVKVCEICGREFVPRSNSQRTCRSAECLREVSRRYKQNSVKESKIPPRKCAVCGTVFQPKRRRHMTCCKECSNNYKKILEKKKREGLKQKEREEHWSERTCRLCGMKYYGKDEYCSQSCRAADFDGTGRRPFTEERGDRMGTADLIRKWHDEGWPAEKIANVLIRDVRQVREVLEG